MTKNLGPDLVLVMRHARMQPAQEPSQLRDPPTLHAGSDTRRSASADLTDVGRALAETLGERSQVGEHYSRLYILAEPTPAAVLTAQTLRSAYDNARSGPPRCRLPAAPRGARLAVPSRDAPAADVVQALPGEALAPYAAGGRVAEWQAAAADSVASKAASRGGSRSAVLVVGHDPRMSWLLQHLMRMGRRGRAGRMRALVPGLAHAEIIALVRDERGRYCPSWSLSPSDPATEDAVRTKIKAKMDSAKVFAGVLTAVATFVAKEVTVLSGFPLALGLCGLALLGAAIALFLVTMFWYDRLTMPPRFWASGPRRNDHRGGGAGYLGRPPTNATWVLYQNMVTVWRRCFVPATVVAGTGLGAYVAAATDLAVWGGLPTPPGWAVLALTVLLGIVTAWVARSSRPTIGVQD